LIRKFCEYIGSSSDDLPCFEDPVEWALMFRLTPVLFGRDLRGPFFWCFLSFIASVLIEKESGNKI
jgi:hypothetical protein